MQAFGEKDNNDRNSCTHASTSYILMRLSVVSNPCHFSRLHCRSCTSEFMQIFCVFFAYFCLSCDTEGVEIRETQVWNMNIPLSRFLSSHYSIHVCGSYLIRCGEKNCYQIQITLFTFPLCSIFFSPSCWIRNALPNILTSLWMFSLFSPQKLFFFFLHDLSLKMPTWRIFFSIFWWEEFAGFVTIRWRQNNFFCTENLTDEYNTTVRCSRTGGWERKFDFYACKSFRNSAWKFSNISLFNCSNQMLHLRFGKRARREEENIKITKLFPQPLESWISRMKNYLLSASW